MMSDKLRGVDVPGEVMEAINSAGHPKVLEAAAFSLAIFLLVLLLRRRIWKEKRRTLFINAFNLGFFWFLVFQGYFAVEKIETRREIKGWMILGDVARIERALDQFGLRGTVEGDYILFQTHARRKKEANREIAKRGCEKLDFYIKQFNPEAFVQVNLRDFCKK